MNHAKTPLGIPLSQFIFGSVLIHVAFVNYATVALAKTLNEIHFTVRSDAAWHDYARRRLALDPAATFDACEESTR